MLTIRFFIGSTLVSAVKVMKNFSAYDLTRLLGQMSREHGEKVRAVIGE